MPSITAVFNTNSSPKSFCRYLPDSKTHMIVRRISDEAFECSKRLLQAIAHIVRTNPIDPQMKVSAKTVQLDGRPYRVIWGLKNPVVEFYDLLTGQGWLFNVKYGTVA